MSFSLSEIEALSRKAARGAGYSWGMAEDAGKSVRWLCSWGLPGAEALARYLQDRDRAPVQPEGPIDLSASTWTAAPAPLCPLMTGAAISDCASQDARLQLQNVEWPLLLLPQVAWPDHACTLRWASTTLCWDGTLHLSGPPLTPQADLVTLSPGANAKGKACRQTFRVNPMPEARHVLSDFATLTYAPETEMSRRTGAGAELVDRD